ncbi:MAG: hypothetical protein H6718_04030 [Polyangiaceae bacterium]|nr:hypothetical protein [Polyangiaceae bacterium]
MTTVLARGEGTTEGCIADEGEAVAVGCAGEALADSVQVCAEKDGQKYWGRAYGAVQMLDGFTACDDPQPELCSLSTCELPLTNYSSVCSLEDTKIQWRCGESDLDENCCKRATCSSNEDCGAEEHCDSVSTYAARNCFFNESGTCGCEGTLGGPQVMVCVPD